MTEKFGCVLARLEVPKSFSKIKTIIDPADLIGDGVEEETHVTVCYGLDKSVTTEDVRKILDGMDIRYIDVEGMSMFQNETQDVLKMDVRKSKVLMELRYAVLELPNKQSFPDYKPHVTVAYVKPGMGAKYLPSTTFDLRFKVSEIIYSYPGRTKQDIIYEVVKSNKKRLD